MREMLAQIGNKFTQKLLVNFVRIKFVICWQKPSKIGRLAAKTEFNI